MSFVVSYDMRKVMTHAEMIGKKILITNYEDF